MLLLSYYYYYYDDYPGYWLKISARTDLLVCREPLAPVYSRCVALSSRRLSVMAAVEIEDDVRTASDDASVDGGGDARMNLRGEEESPLSKASAKDMIRQSDAEAERAALRDAADAAAALAAALGPSQVTQGGAVRPNPYEAAAGNAKSKARDALKMPPPAPTD